MHNLRRTLADLFWMAFLYVALGGLLVARTCSADELPQSMDLDPDVRANYRNPDGSCVQCSNGMQGWWHRDENGATLLWDSAYGPAVRGGSSPSRVAGYARSRGMRIFNVTGADYTFPWMKYCAATNRFCAIGAGTRHFQTLYAYRPGEAKPWGVCNNNSTHKIDWYSEADFRRLHLASGPWIVVYDGPAPASPPEPTTWWQ
jgi:hypothetical protein